MSLFTEIGILKNYIEYEMPQIPCYLIWKITLVWKNKQNGSMDLLLLGRAYSKSFSSNSQQINQNNKAKQVAESSNAPCSATIHINHA